MFNSLSENLGGFREIIDPGFFDGVLADDVRALFNHDPNLVLARRKIDGIGGFAVLEQDARGLAYDFEPTRTSYAIDLRANLEAGVVDQSSFAFRVGRGGDIWEEDEETGGLIRRLLKGGCSALYDVSPVTYPAYVDADSGIAPTRTLRVTVDGDAAALAAAVSTSAEADEATAPPVERTDDGPAGERVQDGDVEVQQAGTSARDERAERLRIRTGEPPL